MGMQETGRSVTEQHKGSGDIIQHWSLRLTFMNVLPIERRVTLRVNSNPKHRILVTG